MSDEGWNMLGACFFGSPFPSLGYNGHVAWSHTVNNPDIVDLYTVNFDDKNDPFKYRYGDDPRQATAWTDDVVVKGEKGPVDRRFSFTKTHHGPRRRPRYQAARHPVGQAGSKQRRLISHTPWDGRRAVADFKEAMRPVACRCSIPWSPIPVATFYLLRVQLRIAETICESSIGQNRSTARIPKRNGRGYLGFDELPPTGEPEVRILAELQSITSQHNAGGQGIAGGRSG